MNERNSIIGKIDWVTVLIYLALVLIGWFSIFSAKYNELHPDLTTMDITMPEMDGISAVKAIKKIDPNAKIVMCSAMGQQAMVIEAIQAGARDFIVKPFQADRVLEAVRKAVG